VLSSRMYPPLLLFGGLPHGLHSITHVTFYLVLCPRKQANHLAKFAFKELGIAIASIHLAAETTLSRKP
jgi:hypothetical protein